VNNHFAIIKGIGVPKTRRIKPKRANLAGNAHKQYQQTKYRLTLHQVLPLLSTKPLAKLYKRKSARLTGHNY
jgi:hypothetical protein